MVVGRLIEADYVATGSGHEFIVRLSSGKANQHMWREWSEMCLSSSEIWLAKTVIPELLLSGR
mgnify:FL=1